MIRKTSGTRAPFWKLDHLVIAGAVVLMGAGIWHYEATRSAHHPAAPVTLGVSRADCANGTCWTLVKVRPRRQSGIVTAAIQAPPQLNATYARPIADAWRTALQQGIWSESKAHPIQFWIALNTAKGYPVMDVEAQARWQTVADKMLTRDRRAWESTILAQPLQTVVVVERHLPGKRPWLVEMHWMTTATKFLPIAFGSLPNSGAGYPAFLTRGANANPANGMLWRTSMNYPNQVTLLQGTWDAAPVAFGAS